MEGTANVLLAADFTKEYRGKQRRALSFTALQSRVIMPAMEIRYPHALKAVEFIRARFHLEFQEPFSLTAQTALRLRRDLRLAGRSALAEREGAERFAALFDPPLSPDPAALRRFQRPGPPFTILPPSPGELREGDAVELEVVFWGSGIHRLSDFAAVLHALGALGWHRGEGRFEVTALEAADSSGVYRRLRRQGRDSVSLAPPVLEAAWWLETCAAHRTPLELTFLAPARLLTGERPLFRPTFARVFPFLLRRVSSVLHACCGVEVVDDPGALIAAASRVKASPSTLVWKDWRTLEGEGTRHELGGVAGSVRLEGEDLEELLWVLNLATLMNAGKSASFGAGHFHLREL